MNPRINSSGHRRVRMAVYLSREAKNNLELLRLRHLDNQGRKPTGTQVIEGLLKAAVAHEKVPVP